VSQARHVTAAGARVAGAAAAAAPGPGSAGVPPLAAGGSGTVAPWHTVLVTWHTHSREPLTSTGRLRVTEYVRRTRPGSPSIGTLVPYDIIYDLTLSFTVSYIIYDII
jgi:hypothetical protein